MNLIGACRFVFHIMIQFFISFISFMVLVDVLIVKKYIQYVINNPNKDFCCKRF